VGWLVGWLVVLVGQWLVDDWLVGRFDSKRSPIVFSSKNCVDSPPASPLPTKAEGVRG
jgi:hypothetical protein